MLEVKILKTIKKFDLLSCTDRVLVGVSGGPDSLALLYLLHDLSVKLGIKVLVGHLNHGIRGRESDGDEKFVKACCGDLGLEFFSKKARQKQPKDINEEKLRKLRHDFLFAVAKKHKVDKIALAHTLDDQAETVLMRLIRGTGLYGLISIMPKRKIGSSVVVRPLVEASRDEVMAYLRKKRIRPRIDRTNFSKKFLRNRIRHELIKDLQSMNPNIKQTLARFAQQAALDYDYLYKQAERVLRVNGKSSIKIDLSKFRRLHTAMQRMVVRIALEKISGKLRTFTYKHWEEIQDLALARPVGSLVNLTKDVVAQKGRGHIAISLSPGI